MASHGEQIEFLNGQLIEKQKEIDVLADWIKVNTPITRPNGSDVSEILDRVTAERRAQPEGS